MNTEWRVVPPSTEPTERPSSEAESLQQARRTTIHKADGWLVWLWRIRALLFVTMCATFGVLLIILPWTPKWTDNPLLLTNPGLRDFISNGFVRGLASGIGILDLWLGFWEAVHYREPPNGSD